MVNPKVLLDGSRRQADSLDPFVASLAGAYRNRRAEPGKKYAEGMFESPFPFNGAHVLWPIERRMADRDNALDKEEYQAAAMSREWPKIDGLDCYGVVDTPEYFAEKFGKLLNADPRPLVVLFSYVHKDIGNKGKGGGWRWHKWGEYIGEGEPTTEYLDDEEKFDDGVYTYHVYMVDNLEWEGQVFDRPRPG